MDEKQDDLVQAVKVLQKTLKAVNTYPACRIASIVERGEALLKLQTGCSTRLVTFFQHHLETFKTSVLSELSTLGQAVDKDGNATVYYEHRS